MRILHVSSVYPPYVVGGAEKVVAMLAEAQAARGHRVGATYLTRDAQPYGNRHGVAVLPQRSRNLLWMEDVFASPRPLRTANKLGQLVNYRAAADFARAIASFRPDIVHTHSMVELSPMIWSAIAESGARSVHTLHDYDLICSRASMFRHGRTCATQHLSCRVTGAWKARFAARIDAVAAVSRPVLAACRLLPVGGWRLAVAGKAQEGDAAYRALAEGLPVEFLGFTDPTAFLDSIDVLVVPSIWREPFGLTVVEAFARGVPVIGSRLGAIADLVGAVGDDWLVAPGDAAALAERMRVMMTRGRAALPPPEAFAPVLAAVTPARMLDAYDDLYDHVLSAARAA